MENLRILIPEGFVEVRPEGLVGRYFVNCDPEEAGWVWFQNPFSRNDSVTYKVGPEEIVISSYSTTYHNTPDNTKAIRVFNPSREFDKLQEFYGELLALANEINKKGT